MQVKKTDQSMSSDKQGAGASAKSDADKSRTSKGEGTAAQDEAAEGKAGEEAELAPMKGGDYMVHVFIEKAKNLRSGSGSDAVNALFCVEVCGKQSYSEVKDKTPTEQDQLSVTWLEHMFFELKGLTSDDVKEAVIEIKLKDKGLFRDQIIGCFELDLAKIYGMNEEHAMHNQWIAMNNPDSEDFTLITAYAQLSVAVQGPGDSNVRLQEPSGIEDADMNPMMPASITKAFKQINIGILSAEALPEMDRSLLTDHDLNVYVSLKWQKKLLRTKTVDRERGRTRTQFGQMFQLGVQWPSAQDRLLLRLFDEDMLTGDDAIGSIVFSIKDIISNYDGPGKDALIWQNIYGAPATCDNDFAKVMNEQEELGSDWKGRVLLYLSVQDTKYPQSDVVDIDEDMKIMLREKIKEGHFDQSTQYSIIADIGAGICLPPFKKKEPYTVKVQIHDFALMTTKPEVQHDRYNRWSQRLETKAAPLKAKKKDKEKLSGYFESKSQTIEELSHFFVYLVDSGGRNVCFWKGKCTDFAFDERQQDGGDSAAVMAPKFKWYPLTNNRAVGKVKNHYDSGMISFRMQIKKISTGEQFSWLDHEPWKTIPKPVSNKLKIRCYIYQCKDLPSADSDGSADPYARIFNSLGQDPRTRIIWQNLNPLFYSTCELIVECNAVEEAPPLVISLWDRDTEIFDFDGDDFLGRAVIDMAAFEKERQKKFNKDFKQFQRKLDDEEMDDAVLADLMKNMPPEPKWYPLRAGFTETDAKCGEVLCSFMVAEEDYAFRQPANEIKLTDYVPMQEQNISINVLGLRQLESFGILPIQKAFVRFNMQSILPPEKAQVLRLVETPPSAPGSSPNINTTINFAAELPTSALYCPKLSCEVFDNLCRGLKQPKIGTFTIDIGPIQHKTLRARFELLKQADRLLELLEDGDLSIQADLRYTTWAGVQDCDVAYIERVKDEYLQQRKAKIKAKVQEKTAGMISEFQKDASKKEATRIAEPSSRQDVLALFESEKGESVIISQQDDSLQLYPEDGADAAQGPHGANLSFVQDADRSVEGLVRDLDLNLERESPYLRTQQLEDDRMGLLRSPPLDERGDGSLPLIREIRDQEEREQEAGEERHLEAGSQESRRSEEDAKLSFTASTMELKSQLQTYFKNSIIKEKTKDYAQEEAAFVLNFKKGLFSNDLKVRNQGQQAFKTSLEELAENRKLLEKRQPKNELLKKTNAEMQKLETSFLSHLQQSKTKNKALLEWKRIQEAVLLEAKMDQKGGLRGIERPKYKLDDRLKAYVEYEPQSDVAYYAVGFDSPQEIEAIENEHADEEFKPYKKHYRRFFSKELEKDKDIFKEEVFHKFDIIRGQSRGVSQGLFGGLFNRVKVDASGFASTERKVGFFKGIVEVYNQDEIEQYNELKRSKFEMLSGIVERAYQKKNGEDLPLVLNEIFQRGQQRQLKVILQDLDLYSPELVDFFKKISFQEMISSSLVNVKEMEVRVYLLEGFDFASRDLGSCSDPYVIVRSGNKSFSGRDKYQIDEPNPTFFERYEFSAKFPGAHLVEIEAYDYDDLFGDDLIGTTLIDLDDRQFCPEWLQISNKPIEYRELYHPSTVLSQGTILCWVEIVDPNKPEEAQKYPKWDITPEPSKDYEVRLSVFQTKNVPTTDVGACDAFIRAWIEGQTSDKKETDTHWRCTTGEASFNWRLLLNFSSPFRKRPEKDAYKLQIQIFDRDLLTSNDLVCHFELDLKLLVDDCRTTQNQIHLSKEYYNNHMKKNYGRINGVMPANAPQLDIEFEDADTFWIKCKPIKVEQKKPIALKLDLRILPISLSKNCKVGDARSEPNHSPHLPAPAGRMHFSLNPFTMLSQLVGPELTRKIAGALCCCLCLALCCALLPFIAGDLTSAVVAKLLGLS